MKANKHLAMELYLDWAYGRDEDIRQSDVISYCAAHGFDYDEIVKLGDKAAKMLSL